MADEKKQPVKHAFKFDLLYFIAVMFAVLLIRDFLVGETHVKTIGYSEFRELLDKGEVKDLVIGPTRITGTYAKLTDAKSADPKPAEGGQAEHFTTVRVDPQIADELTRRNITFSGQPEPGLFENLLSWLLPSVGFILIWMFVMRPMMSGMMSGQGGLIPFP